MPYSNGTSEWRIKTPDLGIAAIWNPTCRPVVQNDPITHVGKSMKGRPFREVGSSPTRII